MNARLFPLAMALGLSGTLLLGAVAPPASRDPDLTRADLRVNVNRPLSIHEPEKPKTSAAAHSPPPAKSATTPATKPATKSAPPPRRATTPPQPATLPDLGAVPIDTQQVVRSISYVGLFTIVSLAPAAVLMVTAFVRINIVLVLLRQALGSPQVPGNQVLTALALMLTALVMRPVGETVYNRAVVPLANQKLTWTDAYREATIPIKTFMLDQIERTNHAHYVWAIYDEVAPTSPGRPVPVNYEDFPMRVVAPAYLLSELTTALVIGFSLYLPFLVVDLVVSAVLAAMGLFMLPPSLVSLPLKLILFVVADGWLKVATMLLRTFGPVDGG